MWKCAAIDHGIAIFPFGKIGPCNLISPDYLKPISEITNPKRFDDLNSEYPPSACEYCIAKEDQNLESYRKHFNLLENSKSGLQFVDIRNTNLCNLKCRTCGPHFSSQWAQELSHPINIQHQSIDQYKDILLTDSLQWMYFTGGEPMINPDHWMVLENLVSSGKSKNISLMYHTNLTTTQYKDKNIIDIWNQFKHVKIHCSIDAIGKPLEYIRSGSRWDRIQDNIEKLLSISRENPNVGITLSPVMSILNIWFLGELFEYAKINSIGINLSILQGPDYLGLDVIPDQLKSLALEQLNKFQGQLPQVVIAAIKSMIENNINQCLFPQTLNHVLLLDSLRNEKLFELLPFKDIAVDTILKNHEYE